jgi:hypothetical protein
MAFFIVAAMETSNLTLLQDGLHKFKDVSNGELVIGAQVSVAKFFAGIACWHS